MNTIKKLTFGVLGFSYLGKLIVLFSSIIFAKILGPEEFGVYSYSISIVTIFTLPVIAGLPVLLLREISIYNSKRQWGNVQGILSWSRWYIFISSCLMVIFIYIYINYYSSNESVGSVVFILMWLIPIRSYLTSQSAVMKGLNYPLLSTCFEQVLAPLLLLSVVFAIVYSENNVSVNFLSSLIVIVSFISLCISFIYLNKMLLANLSNGTVTYENKSWFKELIPLSMIAFLFTLNSEIAIMILGSFSNLEYVAYFKLAVMFSSVISLGLSSINSVTMPSFIKAYQNKDINEAQRVLSYGVRVNCLLSLPVVFFLLMFGKDVINLLFDEEYVDAYIPLAILCIGQIFDICLGSVGAVLNMTKNENKSLKNLLFVFILNVLLLFIFVPIYNHVGAAISVAVSLIFMKIIMTIEVYKSTGFKTYLKLV